jgi:hypothetical protein
VKNHGQFSRVLAWVNKTGNSGRNFLVVDQIADELQGIQYENDESEDSDLSIEITTDETFCPSSRGKIESNTQSIRTFSSSVEETQRTRINTLEGSSKLMDQLIGSLSQEETVHPNDSMEFFDHVQTSPSELGTKGKLCRLKLPHMSNPISQSLKSQALALSDFLRMSRKIK